jgi:RimJ/RimL family protein N-acetyltransferase
MIKEAPRAAYKETWNAVGGHDGPEAAVSAQQAPIVYYMGERIYFRPLELSDEPTLRRWVNDPRNWRTLLHRGPINACREKEWVGSLGKDRSDYVFGIVVKDEERLIGSTGLHRIDSRARCATFGLMIGEVAYQNRGYGSEATRLAIRYGFRELNLNRIQLSVYANNWRAIRAYQKAGFVHEGCLRQAQYVNGEYVDEYRFAILREEWDNLPSVVNTDRYHPARSRQDVNVG